MAIIEAYSLELDTMIDAEKANYFGISGKLTNPQAFLCPNVDCNCFITCTNMLKLEEERVKKPYFTKGSGTHNDDCPHRPKTVTYEKKQSYRNLRLINTRVDAIKFHSSESFSNSLLTSLSDVDLKKLYQRRLNAKSESDTSDKHYQQEALLPIVNKYVRYLEEGIADNQRIILNPKSPKVQHSYSSAFIEIKGQDYNEVNNKWRIYFGKAKVYWNDNNQFRILFESGFTLNNKKVSVSAFIKKYQFGKGKNESFEFYSPYEEVRFEQLKEIVKKRKTITFFVLNTLSYKEKGDNYFANIDVRSVKLIDIKEFDFFN
jgi:hypothetical protein